MSNSDAFSGLSILPTAVVDDFPNQDLRASEPGSAPQTTDAPNALAVLYSALPSDVAASVASELNINTTDFQPTRSPSTTRSTPPVTRSSASVISLATSTSTTASSVPTTLSTISTSTTTSTTSSSASATTTAVPASTNDETTQLRRGAVAGVATGVAAGVVLIIFAAFILLRRRRQGKPLFGRWARIPRSAAPSHTYPEVAWLYDPAPTPPRHSAHYRRGESGISLLPAAYEGAAGVAGAASATAAAAAAAEPSTIRPVRGETRPVGPESPLLPPQASYARDESPGSSGGSSPRSGKRPSRSSFGSSPTMGPIYEEPQAGWRH